MQTNRMRNARSALIRLTVGGILAGGLILPVPADIVTYTNGQTIRGLTRELADDPDYIEFTGARGTFRINRSRISSIVQEPSAQGWVHIGNEHRENGNLAEAMTAYKRALNFDPNHDEAQRMIDLTQAAISQRQLLSRQEALNEIDQLAREAREEVDKRNFEKAEELYKRANDLVPSEEQRQELARQISQMYTAWGRDRLDKLDPTGAEERFNLAVEANRNNNEAINELIKLWEGNPDKRAQAANIYETMLERNPENTLLREKLGRLYAQMGRTEDMVNHYLELYRQSSRYQNSAVERQLIEGLDKLQRQYAQQKDYDRAIRTFNVLASLNPNVDPTAVAYYEYLKRANASDPDNPQQQLELAQFAERNGMDEEALTKYRQLVRNEATREAALQGLDRYARRDLSMAQAHFNSGNYSLAQTLADRVRQEFPECEEVVEQAAELIGHATTRAYNQQQAQVANAQSLIDAGDEFYQTANFHFNNLFSTERRNQPRLLSDKQEARRYYTLAIQAYTEGLRLNPNLSRGERSVVTVRLADARQRLAALDLRPTGGVGQHLFRWQRPTDN